MLRDRAWTAKQPPKKANGSETVGQWLKRWHEGRLVGDKAIRASTAMLEARYVALMTELLGECQLRELTQEQVTEAFKTIEHDRLKGKMRSRVQGIVHDVSDSGATVFVEPMPAIDLGNRWRETKLAEEREEERILRHLSALVGEAGDDFLLTVSGAGVIPQLAQSRTGIIQRALFPGIQGHCAVNN